MGICLQDQGLEFLLATDGPGAPTSKQLNSAEGNNLSNGPYTSVLAA